MSYLYEKSGLWRWLVSKSKASGAFFLLFGAVCVAVPLAVGEATMRATGRNNQQLEEQLMQRGRQDSLAVGRLNNQRLEQLLQEVQRKENTEDRYAAALRGETLTGTPQARVRGGSGTSQLSQQHTPSANAAASSESTPAIPVASS